MDYERSRLTLRVPAIPEIVLLAVGCAEDIVAKQVKANNKCCVYWTKFNLVEYEVSRLERIDEGNPSEVSDC